MVDIRMPGGEVVRFPDELTNQQIRDLIMRKYPGAIETAATVDQLGGSGVEEHYAPVNVAGVAGNVDAFEDRGLSDSGERDVFSIREALGDDPGRLREFLIRRAAEDLEVSSGHRRDVTGQAERLSQIDRARLITALIRANGGKPWR